MPKTHRSCLVNFFIVLAVSEVTKAVTGGLRPNFLARCQPDPAQLAQPFSFQEPVRCTNPDTDEVNQVMLEAVGRHALCSTNKQYRLYGALPSIQVCL